MKIKHLSVVEDRRFVRARLDEKHPALEAKQRLDVPVLLVRIEAAFATEPRRRPVPFQLQRQAIPNAALRATPDGQHAFPVEPRAPFPAENLLRLAANLRSVQDLLAERAEPLPELVRLQAAIVAELTDVVSDPDAVLAQRVQRHDAPAGRAVQQRFLISLEARLAAKLGRLPRNDVGRDR